MKNSALYLAIVVAGLLGYSFASRQAPITTGAPSAGLLAPVPAPPNVKFVAWRDMMRPFDLGPARPEPQEVDKDRRNDGRFRSEFDPDVEPTEDGAPVEPEAKPESIDTESRRWYTLPDHPGYLGYGPIRGGSLVIEYYSPGVPPALVPQASLVPQYPTGGRSGRQKLNCTPAGCY